jgi:hypothetical protein
VLRSVEFGVARLPTKKVVGVFVAWCHFMADWLFHYLQNGKVLGLVVI